MNILKITTIFVLSAICYSGAAHANQLFTLENLERERAALIKTVMAENVSSYQRQQQTQRIYKRLVDIERMVLRDDRIAASKSVLAKHAFEHYELTFLIHASSETSQTVTAHWLSQLKLDSNAVANTTIGAK